MNTAHTDALVAEVDNVFWKSLYPLIPKALFHTDGLFLPHILLTDL